MTFLWTPEHDAPQLSETAKTTVEVLMLEHGVVEVGRFYFSRLDSDHEAFAEYLDRFGDALNNLAPESLWPERTLKTGAVIAMLAYQQAGYLQTIDDQAIAIGEIAADIEGIPDAYSVRLHADPLLVELMGTAQNSRDFKVDEGGYAQVLDIGAGCTRHYLQQAIAA